jgi:arylsulfatase A-like enzyme
MNLKWYRQFMLCLVSVQILIISSCSRSDSNSAQPNIIFIISDDHAFQAIGAYGGKLMPTPNIDRIAKEGAIFHNSFVTNSICGPSRATMLTGKYSHKNGYPVNEEKFNVNQFLFSRLLQQKTLKNHP